MKSARPRRDSGARSQAHMELVADDVPIPPGPGLFTDAIKRLIDVLGALTLLIVLSPVLLIVSLVVKLDSHGPVLFKHRRLGRDGRHFDCLKFRTMCVDAEHRVFQDEQLRHHYVSNDFKIPAGLDPRITRVGRFLRQSSIDELPQLINVLKGEMSLVGPRPIVALEATFYGDMLPVLLSVRPGITGSWATQGRSELNYPRRVDVELEYVRSRTLATDIIIMTRTPWTVLTRRGTA
jgi:exopolysaccharide production protein ExoY